MSPQGIEITGDDMWFSSFSQPRIKIAQLVVAGSEGQGEMNEKNDKVFEFKFDNEPLHSLFKVVKAFILNGVAG